MEHKKPLEVSDTETVVEYLNKICDRYAEELRAHGRKRIAEFKTQAVEARAEIERTCRVGGNA